VSSIALSIVRSAVQFLGGLIFTWLASHGLNIPVEQQATIAALVVTFVGTVGYTAAVRWLETRKGSSWPAVLARALAKLLMLGLTGRQPVYPPAAPPR
jgi:hypothetical protein